MSYYLIQFFLFLIDVVSCFVVGIAEWNWMYSLGLIFLFSELIETMHIPLLRDRQNGSFETKTFEANLPPLVPNKSQIYIMSRPDSHLSPILEVNLPLPTIFKDQPPMCQFLPHPLISAITSSRSRGYF